MNEPSKIAEEIRFELEQLREVAELASALSSVPPDRRQPWDVAAASKFAADFFLGFENLCKRRYRFLGTPFPNGPDSHSVILKDFLTTPGLGASLTPELKGRLQKYLRFRHRFVHSYGLQMRWEIVEEPLRLLPDTVQEVSAVWESWLESVLSGTAGGPA